MASREAGGSGTENDTVSKNHSFGVSVSENGRRGEEGKLGVGEREKEGGGGAYARCFPPCRRLL
jgi:hypothetical protein